MRHILRSLAFVSCLIAVVPAPAAQTTFRVTFDEAVQATAYSGRVYVALSSREGREPRLGMGAWFDPPPLFALEVEGVAPGGTVVLDGTALHHPTPLAELAAGTWFAQGVARRSLDSPHPGEGAGDLCSKAVSCTVGDGGAVTVDLRLTEVVAEPEFAETERAKLFEMESPLLSAFHGRPVRMRAGVVLPLGWGEDPAQRYPILYRIPGFGGSHLGAGRLVRGGRQAAANPGSACLQVMLDPSCYRGHCVFADSANNGPWGTALVKEFIPALEEKFRGPGDASCRFVTGGSSGGWASLWLQVAYPDDFGACFSHVPDPVDFRDFQRIDLYREGESMYVDPEGKPRPLARRGDAVMLWYESFVARETVLGPGGQIHSFEAVFSPRGEDGQPRPLFDRSTGKVDTEVAKSWEPYDIRLVLERNWDELAPKLAGKLHVYAGEVDTFYLEGAVGLLEASLRALGSDAVCRTIPGMAHSSFPGGVQEMFGLLAERWEAASKATAGDGN